MTNYVDILDTYIQLYRSLRNYLWGYEVIQALVDFESSVLIRFPRIEEVKRNCVKLYRLCGPVIDIDEDLKSSFDKFLQIVDNNSITFSYIMDNRKE